MIRTIRFGDAAHEILAEAVEFDGPVALVRAGRRESGGR